VYTCQFFDVLLHLETGGGVILSGLVLRVKGTDLHQILGGYRTFIEVSKIRLALRYVVLFRYYTASKLNK